MKPRKRKAKMALLGIKQAQIAKELKVSRAAVSMVLNGHIRSQRIEAAIDVAISPKPSSR